MARQRKTEELFAGEVRVGKVYLSRGLARILSPTKAKDVLERRYGEADEAQSALSQYLDHISRLLRESIRIVYAKTA